jgi:hypothetical protein
LNEELVNGHLTPQSFVSKAVAKGYKWVAYQWNDGNLGQQQQALASATRQACAGKLIFTVWLTRPFDGATARQAAIESGCQGIILEGEIPSHRPEAVNWSEVTFMLSDLAIPKAIVTNFAPFVKQDGSPWPEKAAPLVDAGWACITENFVTETPTATPARTDFYATQNLGWAETQPMIEAWHIEDYGDLSRFSNVSHWDAGNIL